MNSSGWWAWSIEPGPQITVGMPAHLKLARLGLVGCDAATFVAGQRPGQALGGAGGEKARERHTVSKRIAASGWTTRSRASRRAASAMMRSRQSPRSRRAGNGPRRKAAVAGGDVVRGAAGDRADVDGGIGRIEVVGGRGSRDFGGKARDPVDQARRGHHRRNAGVHQAGMHRVAADLGSEAPAALLAGHDGETGGLADDHRFGGRKASSRPRSSAGRRGSRSPRRS